MEEETSLKLIAAVEENTELLRKVLMYLMVRDGISNADTGKALERGKEAVAKFGTAFKKSARYERQQSGQTEDA